MRSSAKGQRRLLPAAVATLMAGASGAAAETQVSPFILDKPPPLVCARIPPWTDAWRARCAATYRTFNPKTGQWIDQTGRRQFCEVRFC